MSVQLIIKSAAQSVEDFKLTCDLSWTIAQVKDQITASYPTKPAKEHQKLIHGGKLLPDYLPLRSVLNPNQDLHILHLVCPLPSKPTSNKSYSTKEKTVPPSSAAPPSYTVPPLNPNDIYSQVNQQLPPPTPFASYSASSGFPIGAPADAFHQYFAMQQMYSQCMAQYLLQNVYNGNVPYGQVPTTTPPVQQSVPAAAVPQQNVIQNAEPRPDGERWDVVDLLYAFCRTTIFLSILVFYSSVTRVITVCSLIFLLTLFAKLNQRRQNAQLVSEQQRTEQNATRVPEVENDNTANTEVTNDNAPVDSQPVAPAETNVQSALSVPSLILSAVTSFFTSMIPDDPVPVNIN